MTRRLINLLIATLTLTLAAPALAGQTCDKGDYEYGPNCVSLSSAPSPSKLSPRYKSVVYRKAGKAKKVVWEGMGGIVESTSEHIEVGRWVLDENNVDQFEVFTFVWDQAQTQYVTK